MKQPRVHPGYGNTKRNEALKGRHEFPPSSLGGVLNQKTSENMSQSLAQIYIHLIFSTKKRQRSFQEEVLNERFRAYLGGILREIGCPSMAIGTPEDHVHILFCLSRTLSRTLPFPSVTATLRDGLCPARRVVSRTKLEMDSGSGQGFGCPSHGTAV
jgi:hypothetical protein